MDQDKKQAITINQNDEKKTTVQIRTYENTKDSLNILRLMIQGEDDIEKLKLQEHNNMFDELEKKLFQKI